MFTTLKLNFIINSFFFSIIFFFKKISFFLFFFLWLTLYFYFLGDGLSSFSKGTYVTKVSQICLIILWIFSIGLYFTFIKVYGWSQSTYLFLLGQSLIIDYFSLSICAIVLCFSPLLIFLSNRYLKLLKKKCTDFFIFYMFCVFFLCTLSFCFDFMSLFLCLEGLTFSLYILLGLPRTAFAVEASIKYFILGSISSASLAFGTAILYCSTGSLKTLNYLDLKLLFINPFFNNEYLVMIGLVFIIFGFLFKFTLFPNYILVADVYEGSWFPVTFFLATLPKIVFFCIFSRMLYYVFFSYVHFWWFLLMISGVASIIIGCFGALTQKKIKRFLAYASVNQLGFGLLGLSCGTLDGLYSSLYFILIYLIMSFSFFSIIMNLYRANETKYIYDLVYLRELQNLSKKNSSVAFVISILLFSMAGIPPLAGFFAKLNILITLIKSSFYIITGVALLISVISTYYYAQIVRYMFFEKDNYTICYFYDFNNKYLTFIIMCFISFNIFFFCIMDYLALLAFSLSYGSIYIFI